MRKYSISICIENCSGDGLFLYCSIPEPRHIRSLELRSDADLVRQLFIVLVQLQDVLLAMAAQRIIAGGPGKVGRILLLANGGFTAPHLLGPLIPGLCPTVHGDLLRGIPLHFLQLIGRVGRRADA